jgi:hypothetical protein
MHIRYQSGIELDDFSIDFLEAILDLWNTVGIDAARCYALGA